MKIAICDDEYITAEYYYEQIERIFKEYSTECEIELFTDSGKLLSSLYEGKRWDICFLDIDMPLIDGLSSFILSMSCSKYFLPTSITTSENI